MLKLKGFFVFSVFFVLSSCDEFLKEKPAYVHTCKLSDPNLNDCAREQIHKLNYQFSVGLPEFKDIPRTDPYHLKRLRIGQQQDNVSLKMVLSNMVLKGLKDSVIKSTKVTDNGKHWNMIIYFPKINVEADYEVDGQLLGFALKGKGTVTMESENVEGTAERDLEFYAKDGYTFANSTNTRVKVNNVGNFKMDLKNLFGGNKELEKTVNDLINENWRNIVKTTEPIVASSVAKIVQDTTNKLFKRVPAKFFFSDIDEYVNKN